MSKWSIEVGTIDDVRTKDFSVRVRFVSLVASTEAALTWLNGSSKWAPLGTSAPIAWLRCP